jgi:hypothetical protein
LGWRSEFGSYAFNDFPQPMAAMFEAHTGHQSSTLRRPAAVIDTYVR